MKTVADLIVEQLSAWGIEYVFGIPGHTCLGIVDAIRRNNKIKFILVRHEETAALMASAYAKLTGKIGVCLTIAGPGATNLMTGLYDAKMDRAPVLAITGQVKLQYIGPGNVQEIDQDALFHPVSVFNKTINSKEQTIELVQLALKHAVTERGVSHLTVPNNIQKETMDANLEPMVGRIFPPTIRPTQRLVDEALTMINKSEQPVIIAGWGAIRSPDRLLKLAEGIGTPIATTYRAKGIISEEHPLSLGVLGDVGTTIARKYVNEGDILLVLGSSYSELTNIPQKRTIQIDIDPINIGKKFPVELGILGDVGCTLDSLLEKLRRPVVREDYLNSVAKDKREWVDRLKKEADPELVPIRAPYIMYMLRKMAPPGAIFTVDSGDNTFWFGRNYVMTKNQRMLMSGYLGTMAFGLPAALAAKIAFPKNKVFCIAGDGGFSMLMADFTTAVKYDLDIITIILNNNELAMISMEQKMEGYPKFATELTNPDFAEYGRICGGLGFRIEKPEDLKPALRKAVNAKKPAILDIVTDPKRF